jgi:hypothetical protein
MFVAEVDAAARMPATRTLPVETLTDYGRDRRRA